MVWDFGQVTKCLDRLRSLICSPSHLSLFPNYLFPEQREEMDSSRDGSFTVVVYCALHPLYRALHRSKRFDCSSKWGVTTEMVLTKKRWTSLEAKLLQPCVRQPQSSCKEGESLYPTSIIYPKHLPNGNPGWEKNTIRNKSCSGPLRLRERWAYARWGIWNYIYSRLSPRTIETFHI